LAAKSSEKKGKQQALGSENFTIFHALHEVMVKKEEKVPIRGRVLRKIGIGK
jgi:hypothetical protein